MKKKEISKRMIEEEAFDETMLMSTRATRRRVERKVKVQSKNNNKKKKIK